MFHKQIKNCSTPVYGMGYVSFLVIAPLIGLDGQECKRPEYNPDQPGMEHIPLKGFMSLWNPGIHFPGEPDKGESIELMGLLIGDQNLSY